MRNKMEMQSDYITEIKFFLIDGGCLLDWIDETACYGKLAKKDVPHEWIQYAVPRADDIFERVIDETDKYWLIKYKDRDK